VPGRGVPGMRLGGAAGHRDYVGVSPGKRRRQVTHQRRTKKGSGMGLGTPQNKREPGMGLGTQKGSGMGLGTPRKEREQNPEGRPGGRRREGTGRDGPPGRKTGPVVHHRRPKGRPGRQRRAGRAYGPATPKPREPEEQNTRKKGPPRIVLVTVTPGPGPEKGGVVEGGAGVTPEGATPAPRGVEVELEHGVLRTLRADAGGLSLAGHDVPEASPAP